MTPKRAAAYIGGFALLAAWLASAASTSLRRDPAPPPDAGPAVPLTEAIAADIHAQAKRLRQRLATAPLPQEPARNPFAFRVRDLPPAPMVARPVQAFAAGVMRREYHACGCGFPYEAHGDDLEVERTFHRRDRFGLGEEIRWCPRCDRRLVG